MINIIKLMKVLGIEEGALNLESQDVGLNLYHLALCPGTGEITFLSFSVSVGIEERIPVK